MTSSEVFCLDYLIIASAGISDCMVCIDKIEECPDGRNQHFKFQRTAAKFNQANNNIMVTGEYTVMKAEYCLYVGYIFPKRTSLKR